MKIPDMLPNIINSKNITYKDGNYKLKLFNDNSGSIVINYYYKKNVFVTAFEKSLKKFIPQNIDLKEITTYEIERDENDKMKEFFFNKLESSFKKPIKYIENEIKKDGVLSNINYYKIIGLIINNKKDYTQISIVINILWI